MAAIQIEEWVTIARSTEAVFDAITDPEMWAQLEPDVEFEVAGPVRAGTRVRGTLELNGKRERAEGVVSVLERPSRFGVQFRANAFSGAGLVEFSSGEERTRLSVDVELAPNSWVAGLSLGIGGRFVRGAVAKVVRQKLDELKAELESVEPRERA